MYTGSGDPFPLQELDKALDASALDASVMSAVARAATERAMGAAWVKVAKSNGLRKSSKLRPSGTCTTGTIVLSCKTWTMTKICNLGVLWGKACTKMYATPEL